MKLEPYHVYTQNLIQNGLGLNIRLETIKLPGKNIANKLLGIGTGDYFLNLTPKVNATKAKISK